MNKLSIFIFFLCFMQLASACMSPDDMYSVEVALNKENVSYSLDVFEGAQNVVYPEGDLIGATGEVVVYKSQYMDNVAVIVYEIQLPGSEETTLAIRLTPQAESMMADGRGLDVEESAPMIPNPAAVYCIDDGGYTEYVETELGTKGYCVFPDERICSQWPYFYSNGTNCSGLEENETLGIMDTIAAPQVMKATMGGESAFGFTDEDAGQALLQELEFLEESGVITGLSESDIQDIADNAEIGFAGYNSRMVYEDGDWISFQDSSEPMLTYSLVRGCGLSLADLDIPTEDIIITETTIRPPSDSQDPLMQGIVLGFVVLAAVGLVFGPKRLGMR